MSLRKSNPNTRSSQKNGMPKRGIQDEIAAIGSQLKKMVSESENKEAIQPILKQKKNLIGENEIIVEIILTSKLKGDLDKFYSWIGVQSKSPFSNIKVEREHSTIKFIMYNYEDKPVRLVGDVRPVMRMILYDHQVISAHEIDYVLKEVSIETPCCFLINANEQPDPNLRKNKVKLYTNSFEVEAFEIENLEPLGFIEKIENEKFKKKLKVVKLFHEVNDLSIVGQILEQDLRNRKLRLGNTSVLNKKSLIKNQKREQDVSSRDVSGVKNDVTKGFKNIIKNIEENASGLLQITGDSFLGELKESIQVSDKFVEEEKSKHVILKVPKGVLNDLKLKISQHLSSNFNQTAQKTKDQLANLESEVRYNFKQLGIESPVMYSRTFPNHTDEVIQSLRYNRPSFDKQITKKGLNSLFMEIRTPLFMIMPLMMFFGIVAPFFKIDDVGSINKDVLYEGRSAIIIDDLPDFQKTNDKGYIQFANYIFQQSKRKLIQYSSDGKEINPFALKSYPKKVRQFNGKYKTQMEKKLDYLIDENNNMLVLFLDKNADRGKLVEALVDPGKGFLAKESKGGVGGMGSIGKLAPMLGKYRFVFITGLFVLLGWFIQKKKREFRDEKEDSKNREMGNLKNSLSQEVEKMVKTAVSTWRNKILDYVGEQQNNLQNIVDNELNKTIDENRNEVQEQLALIQRRTNKLQDDERNLSTNQKELIKHLEKLTNMKNKFRQLMSTIN